MNKHCIAYGTYTTEEVQYIAEHFDLVVTLLSKASQVTIMKASHADLKAFYYEHAPSYAGAEAWYALDGADKLEHKTYGWLLADIRIAAYRTYMANLIASDLVANAMFNGVFLDDVMTQASLILAQNDFYKEGTTTQGTIPADLISTWNTNMAAMLTEIKAAIGTKLLIINTAALGTAFQAIADGYMDESFGHNSWTAYSGFVSDWKARLDAMISNAASGKIVLAQSGILAGASLAEIAQTQRACYALYLMGASPYTYFYFNTSNSTTFWSSDWDMNVGTPIAVYDTISATVLDRKYDSSFISVNSTAFEGMIYLRNDNTIYPVVPLAEQTKGTQFNDLVHGTKVKKIIDAATDFSATTRMTYLGWVRHDAESPDETKWLVQSTKSPASHLFNATSPYAKIKDMPLSIMTSTDPDFRWPHDNSSFLYVTYTSKFAKMTADSSMTITDLHDFEIDYPSLGNIRVLGMEGGNPSADDRYWGWAIRLSDFSINSLIVYDKDANGVDNGAVISRLLATDSKYHLPAFTGMSPSGNYFILDAKYEESNGGVYIYPKDFSSVLKIPVNVPYTAVHAFPGVGYDDEGNEVIVWVEKKPPSTTDYWVVMANIATGEKTYLTYFGTSPFFNASAVGFSKPGWAVISGNKAAGGASQNWSDGEIFIIELTKKSNPIHWRLVQTHVARGSGTGLAEHGNDLFAKPNKKGTKIFFRSNWGTTYANGGFINAYQIDLPTGWNEVLSRSTTRFPYVINDTTFYPLDTRARPEKGVPYTDPTYHTTITRITDAPTDVHYAGATGTNQAWAGYPKHPSENCNGTFLIIQSQLQPLYHIWNPLSTSVSFRGVTYPKYAKLCNFPANIGSATDADPRWDATDPDVLYYTYRSILYKWQVTPNILTVVHDFKVEIPDMGYVSTREEGTPSDDSRYFAFNGYIADPDKPGGTLLKYHICYDKQTDTFNYIDWTSPLFKPGANNLSMSPSGLWVMDDNSMTIWPRDFSSRRSFGGGGSHPDFALDSTGREVIVNGLDHWIDGVYVGRWCRMVDLETGETFWPAPTPGAQHVSGNCHDRPGWAVWGIIGPQSTAEPPYPPLSEWYQHAIYMVELKRINGTPTDHSKVWRLFQSAAPSKGYSDDLYAKLDKKGTKVYFSSNWNRSMSDKGDGSLSQIDCYQIDLPPTWYADLGADYIPPTNGGQDPNFPKILRFGGEENIVIK